MQLAAWLLLRWHGRPVKQRALCLMRMHRALRHELQKQRPTSYGLEDTTVYAAGLLGAAQQHPWPLLLLRARTRFAASTPQRHLLPMSALLPWKVK